MRSGKKLLSLLLSAAMMLSMLPGFTLSAGADSDPSALTFDVTEGNVTVSAGSDSGTFMVTYGAGQTQLDNIDSTQELTIIGNSTSTSNCITVGTNITNPVNITLDGVTISSGYYAFSIGTGTTVYLTLSGSNSLSSTGYYAGLVVPNGATLYIDKDTSDTDDSLTATSVSLGSNGSAGIGGNTGSSSGTVVINGGTITASGSGNGSGWGGAGIGGGNSSPGGSVTINGGYVTANAGNYAAGIGGGFYGGAGSTVIRGGYVAVTGGYNAAGIGCGWNGSGGSSPVISGGSVNASSFSYTPIDNGGNAEYLVTVTGLPVSATVIYTVDGGSEVSTYTDASGYLYLYLPVSGSAAVISIQDASDILYSASGTVSNSAANTFAVLGLTTTSLSDGEVFEAYSLALSAAGGTTPYTWSATGLPNGLSIASDTGVISGTPAIPGSYSVTVTVKDSGTTQLSVSSELSLSVAAVDSAISPTAASFDKYTSSAGYTDISVTLTLNGNTFSGLWNGTTELASGTDYTVSGAAVTVNKNYLSTLSTGSASLTFKFSAGNDQTLAVTVSDSAPPNSAISPLTVSFDKYTSATNYTDISVTLTLNGNTFAGLWNGATELTSDTDYSVSGTGVTINKSYLSTLSVGSASLTFKFSAGNDQTLVVTVSNTKPSSGSSSGGGSSSSVDAGPTVTVTTSEDTTTAAVAVSGTTSGGTTKASVLDTTMESLIADAKTAEASGENAQVTISMETTSTTRSAAVTIPGSAFSELADDTDAALTIRSGIGTVALDAKAVDSISSSAGSNDVTVSVGKVDPSTLSEAEQSVTQGRHVYELSVTAGGTNISGFGGGRATITLPYTLAEGEDADKIVIYYISDSGELTAVPNCSYDPVTGTVTFTAAHFSTYTIGYNDVSFTDVSDTAWYESYVSFLAARGIIGGNNGAFSPDAYITRAEFVTILARMSGDDLGSTASSFSDVASTDWYCAAVEWAYAAGVTTCADGKFNPNAPITREQMAAMLYRYAEYTGDVIHAEGMSAREFTDYDSISSWALVPVQWAMNNGISNGNPDGSFAPASNATRAEAAKMMTVLIQNMIIS